MIRILLVDDQNLVQQGIKSLLAQDPDLEIVDTLKDGRSAVSKVAELSPDIVLLDIEMPGMDGITATKYITHLAPQTKVIILSSHEDKKYLTQALMAGARAYLLKDTLVKDLKRSIIAVNNGYSQMESRLLAKIFHPSNLKSNNPKHQDQQPRRSPNSTVQATVVQQTPPSRKQSVMFANLVKEDSASASDTVTLNQPPSNNQDAYSESVVQNSALQLSTTKQSLRVPAKSKKYKYGQLIAQYQAMFAQVWASQSLKHQPLINRCQSQMAQYKYQLSPLLKKWQKRGWLTNVGLAWLGLITVIIISRMFS